MNIAMAVGSQTKQRYVPPVIKSVQTLPPVLVPVQDLQSVLYQQYKDLLGSIINLRSPAMMVDTVACENLYNRGLNGKHDKFIQHGRRVANLSIGYLQVPWTGADFDNKNEVSLDQFDRKAAGAEMHVAQKLWAVSSFIRNMQANYGTTPRIYYYQSDEVVSFTLWDEVNGIKFGCNPSDSV